MLQDILKVAIACCLGNAQVEGQVVTDGFCPGGKVDFLGLQRLQHGVQVLWLAALGGEARGLGFEADA